MTTTCLVRSAVLWSMSLAMSGCGPSQQPAEPPAVGKDTALGEMTGAMDKARSVEATSIEHKETIDRTLGTAAGH